MKYFRSTLFVSLAIALAGCSGLFYFPSRDLVVLPSELGLKYEDIAVASEDGTKLHGWHLPADEPWALVVFFHGNAQNIAYHLPSVYWLPKRGVSVISLDFRGYGKSEGEATVSGLQQDVRAGVAYGLTLAQGCQSGALPVYVFAESLGGSTAISALADSEITKNLSGMIIEGAFSSYHLIAREKLQLTIFTWPFAWPLSYLVTDRYSPLEAIPRLSPLPLFIVHGLQDVVVAPHHSELLYSKACGPKSIWLPEGAGHLDSFKSEAGRERFIDFLKRNTKAAKNIP